MLSHEMTTVCLLLHPVGQWYGLIVGVSSESPGSRYISLFFSQFYNGRPVSPNPREQRYHGRMTTKGAPEGLTAEPFSISVLGTA